MAEKTCICGDVDPAHKPEDHKLPKSLVPALFIGVVLAAGYKHAKSTGNCLCGDIFKSFTGRRPRGAA